MLAVQPPRQRLLRLANERPENGATWKRWLEGQWWKAGGRQHAIGVVARGRRAACNRCGGVRGRRAVLRGSGAAVPHSVLPSLAEIDFESRKGCSCGLRAKSRHGATRLPFAASGWHSCILGSSLLVPEQARHHKPPQVITCRGGGVRSVSLRRLQGAQEQRSGPSRLRAAHRWPRQVRAYRSRPSLVTPPTPAHVSSW